MSVLQQFRATSTLKSPIFVPTVIFVAIVAIFCSVFPEQAQTTLNAVKLSVFANFSWFYIFAGSIFFLFLMFLCVSSLGGIRLGADTDEPEFSFPSWIAMLFAAGMGIGLMYFGVAEPVLHYLQPLEQGLTESERMKDAMMMTFYHWGIHAWAIYAVIALALAYFGFRYKLPLTVRSGFYPLMKNRISNFWGHVIDVVALCSTIFGLTTTLGYGAMQVNAGFNNLGLLDGNSFNVLAMIVIVAMTLAVISAISGVGKGVKILSEINLVFAGLLLVFVITAGPTLLLFSGLTENLGYYFSSLLEVSFRTFAYEPENQEWLSNWTVLYWAWWASWAPFVGMFIAKISKGRTIREFVLGVLFVPSLFNILWMTSFGGSAIWVDQQTNGALAAISSNTEALLFGFFDQLPFGIIASVIAVIIISIFFVTSADSGIFVLNTIASQGEEKAPKWQSILWGILLTVLGLSLLYSGGLASLQTMTLIIALPFMAIMIALCFGLWKGLMVDSQYSSKAFSQGSATWTSGDWKVRLEKIVNPTNRKDIRRFLIKTARPAFKELVEEFETHDLTARMNFIDGKNPKIEFEVVKENLRNFLYGIECQSRELSDLVVEDGNVPNMDENKIYEPITYFFDGRQGYDVQYMTKDELIADVLKQYERFMNLAMDDSHDLMTADVENMGESTDPEQ
ncbi:transporter [Actinobacillus succinogenes]|uniref:Choline/carnitine/betaine transporter n=1 Tax=Actinobacillus succinogenes (strain ATCC 55618 / DSM 22257 / CCUG 43843 / 130Z) TaxID=339671 RepID=A6VLS6_ACTSZ|nr:BCCT family transporter [Actinobacillus succinogenes]ABR73923.1 choline/carnitine/betaine transporter [Actinobacillus succinogenes 130Z]PHI39629.1 transporter [Actinobacillus succinogenes]